MPTTIESLEVEIKSSSATAVSGIDALASSLSKLKNATKGGIGLTTVSKQVDRLNSALSNVNGSEVSKIDALSASLQRLQSLGSTSFSPLVSQIKGLGNAFNNLPSGMSRFSNSAKGMNNTVAASGGGFVNLWAKAHLVKNAIAGTIDVIHGWVNKSNEYIEDMNLFSVAMGEYAGEAQKYAEQVGELVGIDPAAWMRNQGIFNTIIEGFGVAGDKAALMSKNLTQLGYDISSFYNIPVEDAMTKLTSGISGELEPLRRLGYDLSVARLQQTAYNLGINQSVQSMTQAEKSQQ